MITEICPREQCTGCGACFNICPKECISMVSDPEGFLYPEIDSECCDNCGACERVCPILHLTEPDHSTIPEVYACWNKDEGVRFQSASGGVFSALAEHILDNGGVVFGAAFDENMIVRHIAVHRVEDLRRLRSSKYVQSDVGRCYTEVRDLLRQGRKVLFSGTPCQVAALNAFIGRDDENLVTCDMLCHGVPSPGVLAEYVESLEKHFQAKLVNINFRHKRKGWHFASTVAYFSDGREHVLRVYWNSFMHAAMSRLSVRCACYQCPYTSIDRGGDITLGDFWGIGELAPFRHSTRNGISLVLVNTERGRRLFEASSSKLFSEERALDEAKHTGTKLSHPLPKPKNRAQFFADYQRLEYEELAKKHLVDKGLKGLIKRFVPRTWIFYLRKYMKRG